MYEASEGNKIVSYSPYPNMEQKMYFALDVITLGQVTGEIQFRNKANPEWMSVEEAKKTHLLDAFGSQDDFVYWCGVVPDASDWFEIKIGDGNPLHVNMIPWKVQ